MNEKHIADKIALYIFILDRQKNKAWALLVVLIVIVGFWIISHYSQDNQILGNNKIINISQISNYENTPYYMEFLSTSDYEGLLVELNRTVNSRFWDCVLSGEYDVNFVQDNEIVGTATIAGNEEIQVIECPKEVADVGYNKILFIPKSGQTFYISYLSKIQTIEDSKKRIVQTENKAYHLGGENYYTGTAYDITGIVAYFDSKKGSAMKLIVGSANSELTSILLAVENEEGDTIAKFPEGTSIPPYGTGEPYALIRVDTARGKYDIRDIYVSYKYKDDNTIKRAKVDPFKPIDEEIYNGTLVRTRDNTRDFPQLVEKDNKVYFSKNNIVLNKPLFIPEGKELLIKEGQTIDLVNGAFIVSRSPVRMIGTKDKPILIHTSDNSVNAGLAVIQADTRSTLEYVTFDNLGEVSSGIWHLTGAVTFYESDVDFHNCDFLNNRSVDGLNTVRSDISLRGCTIKNTYQDAFDSDFCSGTFDGCYFANTGNDGFDVSTSTFSIKNTNFKDIHDKAVSVGERSTVTIENISAENVQIGIGAKDSSVVKAKGISIKNMLIGFCSYQKKPEFGPCNVSIDGYSLEGNMDFRYLIEKNDVLTVNGVRWEPSNNKKQAIIIKRLINEEPIR